MLDTVDAALKEIGERASSKANEIEIKQEATSLDLLQAVYRNPDVPLSVRMRAASMAIPYEFPKLSVVATVNDPASFAERLERCIQRSGIRPLLIEHAPQLKPVEGSQPGDVTGNMLATERKGRRL